MNYRSNKYNAIKKTVDGITFDSTHEARRYCELKLAERAGSIRDLRLQVRFDLIPPQRVDGCLVERGVVYNADFVYTDVKTGETVVEDAKSPATRTAEYILKRKLMLYIHHIQIVEV